LLEKISIGKEEVFICAKLNLRYVAVERRQGSLTLAIESGKCSYGFCRLNEQS
jgi:hypothetical protein